MIKENLEYNSFKKFKERVGILDKEELLKLGLSGFDDSGKFTSKDFYQLINFCKMSNAQRFILQDNNSYHIASESNDHPLYHTCSNSIRFFKATGYYLCKGDASDKIYFIKEKAVRKDKKIEYYSIGGSYA